MQNKRLIGGNFHQTSQFLLLLRRVNMRVLMVVKQTEKAVDAHIDARRLNHRIVKRLKYDTAVSNFSSNIAV